MLKNEKNEKTERTVQFAGNGFFPNLSGRKQWEQLSRASAVEEGYLTPDS